MRALGLFFLLFVIAQVADASIADMFKDEQGRTKWQHVANFSGSVLILLLTITLSGLLYSQFKLRQRNRELRDIKKNLEKLVQRRTENLNQSNRLLQQSNQALEDEIAEHKGTSALLLSSQNYLQSILASMPSMLIGLNDKMEITHWNQTAESITGRDSASVAGKYLWDAYPTITLAPDQVKQVLNSREPLAIKHSQRGQYYFDITVYPLGNEQSGVVVVVENVTQRSLAENMLIQRDKMASMGELAATMAHDINIPLQGISEDVKSVAEQISALEGVPEDAHALLQDAIDRCDQTSSVVNNLLEFSDSQVSDTAHEKSPASIVQIIDHSVELANAMLSEPSGLRFRDIALQKSYMESPPNIHCYIAELQQVFLSLFRHACNAMARKDETGGNYSPEMTIEISEAYDALWVKVQHNGIGLSPEEQQDIFEPIVQHTTPTNPKPLVAENRLSFSYFIITEHHDGEIAVTSDPELGSTFHIQFHLNSA